MARSIAALLVVAVVLEVLGSDLADLVVLLAAGILIPAWSVWLARSDPSPE